MEQMLIQSMVFASWTRCALAYKAMKISGVNQIISTTNMENTSETLTLGLGNDQHRVVVE